MGTNTYYELIRVYRRNQLSIGGDEIRPDSDDRYLVQDCVRLPDDYLCRFIFRVNQKGCGKDFLANSLGWHVVSARVKVAIEQTLGQSHESDVQFLEFSPSTTRLECHFGTYYLLNVLRCLPCLDFTHSDLAWELNDVGERYIAHAHEIVLLGSKIPASAMLFRVSEFKEYVIAHESLVKNFQYSKVSNFTVEPVKVVSS